MELSEDERITEQLILAQFLDGMDPVERPAAVNHTARRGSLEAFPHSIDFDPDELRSQTPPLDPHAHDFEG